MGSEGSRLAESERGVWFLVENVLHPISIESTSSCFSGGEKPFLPRKFWSPGANVWFAVYWVIGAVCCFSGKGVREMARPMLEVSNAPLHLALMLALTRDGGTSCVGRWLRSRPMQKLGEISMSFYMIHILVFFSVYTVVAPGELMSQDVTSAARDAARSELACAVPARSTLPLPDLNDTSRGLQRFDMDVQARPQEWAEANVLFLFYKYVSPLLCIHFMRAGIEWHR